MANTARDEYLTTQVLTATPQKLHLMLIDGAMQRMQRAKACWEQDDDSTANSELIRAELILGQLLTGLSAAGHELADQFTRVYVYLFSTLTRAHADRDCAQLDVVLNLLATERDTWAAVCEKFGDTQSGSVRVDQLAAENESPALPAPHVPARAAAEVSGGFSVEA
jgi:flagellar protein FliS